MGVKELIRERRSNRTFDGRPLPEDIREKLMEGIAEPGNPFGLPLRFMFLDHAGKDREYPLGTKGVVLGTETYVAAAISRNAPHAMEAFGYDFERFCLHALSMGVGTVILAASVEREAFERAIRLRPDEMMPTITPVGYAAGKDSVREFMMRKGLRSEERLAFQELFFDRDFRTPLTKAAAGEFAEELEMVRLAPSAGNGQPWRVVRSGLDFHFFRIQRPGTPPTPASELKKMDVGIAMCHFDLARKEDGLPGRWLDRSDALGFELYPGIDYIYTFSADEAN